MRISDWSSDVCSSDLFSCRQSHCRWPIVAGFGFVHSGGDGTDAMKIAFDNSFHRTMEGFYAPAEAASPPAPTLLAFNRPLADRLGIDLVGREAAGPRGWFSGVDRPQGRAPRAGAGGGRGGKGGVR